jgi:hypothetical protein
MFMNKKPEPLKSTTFSEFVRNASSGEKKKVFTVVLKKSCEDQQKIIRKSKKLSRSSYQLS